MEVALVTWTDTLVDDRWRSIRKIAKGVAPPTIESIGQVVGETEDALFIAHTIHEGEALGTLTIPRGCILSIDYYEVA